MHAHGLEVKLIPLLCPSTSATKVPIERVNSAQPPEAADSQLELPAGALRLRRELFQQEEELLKRHLVLYDDLKQMAT